MHRKILAITLSFLLCVSMIACGDDPTPQKPEESTPVTTTAPSTSDNTTTPTTTTPTTTTPSTTDPVTTPPVETDPPQTEPPVENQPLNPTVSENGNVIEYLYPEELVDALKLNMQTKPSYFTAFSAGTSPYMIQAEEFLSNGTVHSIAFPLWKTAKADDNGNFKLTLSIFGKDLSTGLKASALSTHVIEINGDEYGLSENSTVQKWITIDVSKLNISVKKDECIAFFSATDTLFPAYSNSSQAAIKNLIDTYTDAGTGFLTNLGSDSLGFNRGTLIFNIGMERSYTPDSDTYQALLAERTAYEALLQALAEKYRGKTLSVFGDSISTWGGVSNNTDYNMTIGDNAVYYPAGGGNLSDVSHTYWMKTIDALDMKLCVNNSWSGGRVYGKSDLSYVDSAVQRATQLHDDNGTPNDPSDDILPDVILFYMGINDINNKVPFGNLMIELASASSHEDKLDAIDEWVSDLYLSTNGLKNLKAETNYTNFQEAYALTLYQMRETYPNAEIYCLNLLPCVKYLNNNGNKLDTMESYNEFIALMAEYFELTVVDQYHDSDMKFDTNIQFYTEATDLLHPNAAGHTKMAELILDTIANKNKAE